MLLDFALDTGRNEGKTPHEAVHRACPLRFHPILTTTTAPLLGTVLLMTGTDIGSELRRPLGLSIVGGLLTLFATPMIYQWFGRPRQRCFNRDDVVGDAEPGRAQQESAAE
jgi:multidrug efflux pump subunit AcrB